jgi:16S rRNA (uracil1498-N3)-methyltransferase
MHRFFVSPEILHGEKVVIAGSQAHQIRDVLRMTSGDRIIVLDNTGYEYSVSLTKIEKREVSGEVISKNKSDAEPNVQITLFQSLLAREKFEWVLQKCTEVGVCSFVPVVTQRSIVRRSESVTAKKMSRWHSIITEAAEQSCRGRIPRLESPLNFSDVLTGLDNFDCSLFGSIQIGTPDLREIIKGRNSRMEKIALFIGPEGGFTEEEIADAGGRGAKALSLGKRVLRTETAAVVASSLILYELEQYSV